MITEEMIAPYVENGLVNKQTNGDFTIYCYSKETFFDKQWDEVTKACRGLVFYKGVKINNPFPKIFNLDETEDTTLDRVLELIETHRYVLCHKANGHLTIVTYVPEVDDFIVHTKGSLQDNEMNEYDRRLFYKRFPNTIARVRKLGSRMTFMYESINPSDKHTLYDQEVLRYGEDQLVLLGGYFHTLCDDQWHSLPPYSLLSWAAIDSIPVVKMDDAFDLDSNRIADLFKEEDTEGYVIWFPAIDFRVKIKTDEYWKLRFIKDLKPEVIIDRFVAGGAGRLWSRYPEEIADKVVELVSDSFKRFYLSLVEQLPVSFVMMTRKEVGMSETLSPLVKSLIFAYKDDRLNNVERMMTNSKLRQAYFELVSLKELNNIQDELVAFIEDRSK
jgi:hypothetical protein